MIIINNLIASCKMFGPWCSHMTLTSFEVDRLIDLNERLGLAPFTKRVRPGYDQSYYVTLVDLIFMFLREIALFNDKKNKTIEDYNSLTRYYHASCNSMINPFKRDDKRWIEVIMPIISIIKKECDKALAPIRGMSTWDVTTNYHKMLCEVKVFYQDLMKAVEAT